ncbi:L,D-transpeptidase family protein [Marilutibacter aestuarii]|uniref:Murein L,D-transpeptidase n=1 Tax=Marilutibacter aestuarii TaxID=1706195 RepID=A0A508A9U3_9GAMM|nr:L,D-transpeptidase [Lysobacter aestuarii]TQD46636.1 murein L,D-transpeptidase [Lysobacter aestuarii]
MQERVTNALLPRVRLGVLALALSLCLPLPALARQGGASASEASAVDPTASRPSADAPNADGWLRVQVLLDRAHFSPGEIDGVHGSNTARAIAGFQRHQGLETSGELDDATWRALTESAPAATVAHTLEAADVAGPFVDLPEDMAAKAKLEALGYESPEEALGERFHASPDLLRRLNPGARFAAGESIRVPNVLDGVAPLPQADKVVVDKSDAVIMLVDAADKVLAQYPATMGSEHDPLPIGEWTINGVARDPVFHYNPDLFWDAEPSDEKAKIPAGPNNPVGVVWVDLSKPHYGIHGTPEPSTIGKTESHGCIRMTNWSAKALSDAVAPGTAAVLRE